MLLTIENFSSVGYKQFMVEDLSETWSPLLERPINFSGPELYFKFKIYRMVV